MRWPRRAGPGVIAAIAACGALGLAAQSCGVMTSGDDCVATATCIEGGGGNGDGADQGTAEIGDDAIDVTTPTDVATEDVTVADNGSTFDSAGGDDGTMPDVAGDAHDASADVAIRDVLVDEAAPLIDGCVPTTTTENCTDGLDDDCNGMIDCAEAACQSAGYTCTSPPPAGWTGPALLWTGAFGATAPACPPSYQAALDAHMGPTGSPDTCTCTCNALGGTCSATPTFHVDQQCTVNQTCATVTASNGTCATVPSNGCGNGGTVTVGAGALPAPTGGSCSPNVIRTPGPAPGWTTSARVCHWTGRVDTPGGCNMPTDQCLLGPPTGFAQTMCVFQSGTPACPAAYPNPTILYSSESDARGCGSCVCGTTPTGGSCSGTTSIYAGTSGCTGASATYTLGSKCQPNAGIASNPAYVQGHYTLMTAGSCPVTTQPQPTGGVVGTGATTVCCK